MGASVVSLSVDRPRHWTNSEPTRTTCIRSFQGVAPIRQLPPTAYCALTCARADSIRKYNQHAAGDGDVLEEVIELVLVVRDVGTPEAMEDQADGQQEQRQQQGAC